MMRGFLNNTSPATHQKFSEKEKGKHILDTPESPKKSCASEESKRDLSDPDLWAELVQVLDPLDIMLLQESSNDSSMDFTDFQKSYKHLMDGFEIPSCYGASSSSSSWIDTNESEDWCIMEDLKDSQDVIMGEPPPMTVFDHHRHAKLPRSSSELSQLRPNSSPVLRWNPKNEDKGNANLTLPEKEKTGTDPIKSNFNFFVDLQDTKLGEPPPSAIFEHHRRHAWYSYSRSELLELRNPNLSLVVNEVDQIVKLDKLKEEFNHAVHDLKSKKKPHFKPQHTGVKNYDSYFLGKRKFILRQNHLFIDKFMEKKSFTFYHADSYSVVSIRAHSPPSTTTSDDIIRKEIKKKKKKKKRKKKGKKKRRKGKKNFHFTHQQHDVVSDKKFTDLEFSRSTNIVTVHSSPEFMEAPASISPTSLESSYCKEFSKENVSCNNLSSEQESAM